MTYMIFNVEVYMETRVIFSNRRGHVIKRIGTKNRNAIFVSALTFLIVACGPSGDVNIKTTNFERDTIRAYIMDHPEVIQDALVQFEENKIRTQISAVSEDLYNNANDFSIGPLDANVVIVEFFDYNCSFCKRSVDWIETTLIENPKNVRFIFKELPVLERAGNTSRYAAKAALAAKKQGKYLEAHMALMASPLPNQEQLHSVLEKVGIDIDQLQADISSGNYDDHINSTKLLASKIPSLNGTPFFIVNDELIPGANIPKLQEALDDHINSKS